MREPVDWLHDREGEDDDFDDELDTRPEEEDEPPEDYTWPGEEGGEQ